MFQTLSVFISTFSTSRTITLLILTLLSNMLQSHDVCLFFYLQNVLYSLQTCQSVICSDRKLLVLALQCIELVLQQVGGLLHSAVRHRRHPQGFLGERRADAAALRE